MWIVMEKLDVNLHTAIKNGLLKHGRDEPERFTVIVAGIVGAVAYLHSPPMHGKPSSLLLNLNDNYVIALTKPVIDRYAYRSSGLEAGKHQADFRHGSQAH